MMKTSQTEKTNSMLTKLDHAHDSVELSMAELDTVVGGGGGAGVNPSLNSHLYGRPAPAGGRGGLGGGCPW